MSIKIKFSQGGQVDIQPNGYPGRTCFDASRPYTDVFGGKQAVQETGEQIATQAIDEVQQQQTGNQ